MSWSISVIGKPENVVKAIEEQSAKETGQCKVEFDDAKDHLIGLVKQNFVVEGKSGYVQPLIKLEACGSGCQSNGEQTQRSCTVKIEQFHMKMV
jgi:hypothetical protein